MTDMIPADAVREIIARHRDGASGRGGLILDDLKALLPTPPTLADMSDEERNNAVGMWADVSSPHPYRGIIDDIPAPRVPVFKPTAGELTWTDPENVTPRPDMGRAWSPMGTPVAAQDGYTPDELTYIDTAPAPAKVGDTIESADDPRLAALPVGSILVDRDGGAFEVTKADTGEWGGIGYVPSQGTGTKWGPWTVRRIGKKADQ